MPFEVALAIVFREGKVLVTRRLPGSHFGGYWEFPGGKANPGEAPERCAEREVLEETGVVCRAIGRLPAIHHVYPDREVRLTPVECEWVSGQPVLFEVAEARFVEVGALRGLDFPPANEPLVDELIARASRKG